ncbi:MAG: flagellar biosynthesis anti-sigma factor FlgM [Planctomycetes bacterium]|nr:flagellar biosynthesis anti-sigma factor FlgM [Planctomycetota bacterium]
MNEINQIQSGKTPQLLKAEIAKAGVSIVRPLAQDDSTSDASASLRSADRADRADRVELSDAGAALAEAGNREAAALEASVRIEKVAKIRSDIQNNIYDVNGRLKLIVNDLIDDITKT